MRLQSGTCAYLDGTKVCSGSFWKREGRLTAKVALPDETLILGAGDEFLIGEKRYRVEGIEEAENGNYLVISGLDEKLKPETDTAESEALVHEREEAGRLRRERSQRVRDHTFKIPSRHYRGLLEDLQQLTPDVLTKLNSMESNFTVLRWESELESQMERNLKEGEMGPNTTETNQAVFAESGAQAFTTVNITRWNPHHIANMSASAEWCVDGERIFCSLHCEADGVAYQACVMGAPLALDYVKEFLLLCKEADC